MNTLRKLLVVDDDPVVGKSFDRVLSGRGYAVVTASDGAEALRKIAAEQFDMVYTDIKMPGMDGIAVAEEIRKSQPWLPVVIVSGYATPENEARAKAAGVSAVLHKPLSPQMIEESAREAFRDSEAAAAPEPAEMPAPATMVPTAPATVAPSPHAASAADFAKRVGLVVAAPLLGLAYVVVVPVVGLAMLVGLPVWYAVRALARRVGGMRVWLKNVALFLAAPFVGLAYVIAMPFVMAGMLVWMGVKAVRNRLGRA
jgi:CheY-like chemotaxis protein